MEFFDKFSDKWLHQNTIYLTNHGSVAYGTNTPKSDKDIRGICICPKEYYFGFTKGFEQAQLKEPDVVIFEIRKFLKLAANANPNCLEILFVNDEDILFANQLGQKILDNRNLFLSKQIKRTMMGYATYNLQKIKKDKPIDYKDVCHLVRLIRMTKEALLTGKLNVKRHDREELLAIKNGAWSYEQIVSYAAEEEININRIYDACNILPDKADIEKINTLCIEIIQEFYDSYFLGKI